MSSWSTCLNRGALCRRRYRHCLLVRFRTVLYRGYVGGPLAWRLPIAVQMLFAIVVVVLVL